MANPPIATAPRIVRSARFATVGQSIATMYNYQSAYKAFVDTLTAILALPNKVEIANFAIGGTYASKLNRDADAASGVGSLGDDLDAPILHTFQTDDTGPSPVDGEMLVGVAPRMAGRAVGAKIQHFIHDGNGSDAQTMAGMSGVAPTVAAQRYYNAWVYAFGRYRAGAEAPSSSYIGMQIAGRHNSAAFRGTFGWDRYRQEQLRLIANNAKVFKLCETYDIELRDAIHPAESDLGLVVLAQRAAESFAKNAYGVSSYGTVTIYDGPSISGWTKVDDTHIKVSIAPNFEAIKYPKGMPCCFAFAETTADLTQIFNANNPIPVVRPVKSVRSGNNITFTLPTAMTNPRPIFPFDQADDFSPDLKIYGASSGKPLQSLFRG
jgi:hypothetical protein